MAAWSRIPICLAFAGLLAGLPMDLCAADVPAPHPVVRGGDATLIDLIAQRLDLAQQVAWTKYHTGAPVYDAAREASVLKDLMARAAQSGMASPATTAFFTAQIAASRQVQTEAIASWKNGAPQLDTKPLDLQKDIRPRLDILDEQMLVALAAWPDWPGDAAHVAAVGANLQARGFSPAVAGLAAQGTPVGRPKPAS